MDQDLETILKLVTTLHQTPTHTQTLETPTARHLATAMDPPSHDLSWRVVTVSDLTKSKSSMKLPEEITEFSVLVLLTLFSTIKPLQIYIEDITRWREHMNFMFEWQEQYLTRSLRSLVRYCSGHENIKFISSS